MMMITAAAVVGCEGRGCSLNSIPLVALWLRWFLARSLLKNLTNRWDMHLASHWFRPSPFPWRPRF